MSSFSISTPGLTVLYAYGWVDLQSPSGVPYQVVVGIARDPLMMVCLQVSDLPSSVEYFRAQLGMSEQPFPLARAEESQYEVKQPKGSVHMGYGPIGFSVLLVPLPEADEGWLKFFKQKKKVTVLPEVAVGNVLNTFTIVFDDSVTESLPALYKEIIDDQKKDPAVRTTVSPDGYKFKLLPYSEYVKSIKK